MGRLYATMMSISNNQHLTDVANKWLSNDSEASIADVACEVMNETLNQANDPLSLWQVRISFIIFIACWAQMPFSSKKVAIITMILKNMHEFWNQDLFVLPLLCIYGVTVQNGINQNVQEQLGEMFRQWAATDTSLHKRFAIELKMAIQDYSLVRNELLVI